MAILNKKNRIAVLLLILAGVAGHNWYVKHTTGDWSRPLLIGIYASNGDNLSQTKNYLASLDDKNFTPITHFLVTEAGKYGIKISNTSKIELRSINTDIPQAPPGSGSMLDNILWSLKFRYWANVQMREQGKVTPDIALFVTYFHPDDTQSLAHSVGLKSGMIGIINAFADKAYNGSNNIVITHEMLHTLGATDKYDSDNQPIFPIGYADPNQTPLYPQYQAEIMGGRIPVSNSKSKIPESLNDVVIGSQTAIEINWY